MVDVLDKTLLPEICISAVLLILIHILCVTKFGVINNCSYEVIHNQIY